MEAKVCATLTSDPLAIRLSKAVYDTIALYAACQLLQSLSTHQNVNAKLCKLTVLGVSCEVEGACLQLSTSPVHGSLDPVVHLQQALEVARLL